MGIAEVAVASVNADTATATYTVSKPSGTASGHVLIAIVEALSTGLTFTPPSGWTQIGSVESGGANIRSAAWYKVAGGSEPSSYAWTLGATFKGFGWIGCYSGVDTTTPIDSYNSGAATPAASTCGPSDSISSANSWLITAALGRHAFASAKSISTSDGSDTSRYAHGSSSGSGFDYSGAVWDSARDLTSGTATRTLTISTGTDQWSWWTVALKPAAGATLAARVYQAALSAPMAAAALKARLYQAYLRAPAAGGGYTGRVYSASLSAPLAAGQPGHSGLYVARGGNTRAVAIYVDTDGDIT